MKKIVSTKKQKKRPEVRNMKQKEFTRKDGTKGVEYKFEEGDVAEAMFDKVGEAEPRAINVPDRGPVVITDRFIKVKMVAPSNIAGKEITAKLTEQQAKSLNAKEPLTGKTIEAKGYTSKAGNPCVGLNVR